MFQLGIDVSKKTLDLCLLREGVKGRVKTRRLKNDVNAASTVITWLGKQQCAPADVHIIMEATGIYHESLPYGLYKAGAKVSLANPLRSREFALVTDRSREKNRREKDTLSAIAESIENVLRNLSVKIEHLEELILTRLEQHPELKTC